MEEYMIPDAEIDTGRIVPDLSKYETFEQITYKPTTSTGRGARHVYGAEADGSLTHLSHDAVLTHFGYGDHVTPMQDYRLRLREAAQIAAVEAEALEAAAAVAAEVPQPEKPGPGARVRERLLRPSVAVASLPERVARQYRNPETRRRAIVITAGAAALGAVLGVALYRYGIMGAAPTEHFVHPDSATPPLSPIKHQVSVLPVTSDPPPAHTPRHVAAPLKPFNARSGAGTIWYGVRRYAASIGFHHLRSSAVQRLTRATLGLNHLNWREARRLPVGYPVRMLSKVAIRGLLR